MNHCKKTVWLIIILITTDSVVTEITRHPRDTEAAIGQTIYFNCSTSNTSSGIKWDFQAVSALLPTDIYSYGEYHGEYETRSNIEKYDTGAFNLVLDEVQSRDAGTYTCHEEGGDELYSSAELVVLDSTPVCGSNSKANEVIGPNRCYIQTETIQLSCQTTYTGNIPPNFDWRRDNEDDIIHSSFNITSHDNFTSYLLIRGNTAQSGSYFCETGRFAHKQYSCSPQPVKIIYAFDNFTLTYMKVGEIATCWANTSQPCTYRWIMLDGIHQNIVSYNNAAILLDPGLYRCEADCTIKDKHCPITAGQIQVLPLATGSTIYEDKKVSDSVEYSVFRWIMIIVVATGVTASLILFSNQFRARLRRLLCRTETLEEDLQLMNVPESPGTDNEINQLRVDCSVARKKPQEERPKPISGVAVFGEDVFVSRYLNKDIEVYDFELFTYKNRLLISGLICPENVVSCFVNKSLYVLDLKGKAEILRINPQDGIVIVSWSTNESNGQISVGYDATVIFSVYGGKVLMEYKADGTLIRQINLAFGTDATSVHHATKLQSGLFVVCCEGFNDTESKVCLLQVNETNDVELVSTFGKDDGSLNYELKGASCLAIDEDGSIIVSDFGSSRLFLLQVSYDNELQFVLMGHERNFHANTLCAYSSRRGLWLVADFNRLTVWSSEGKMLFKVEELDVYPGCAGKEVERLPVSVEVGEEPNAHHDSQGTRYPRSFNPYEVQPRRSARPDTPTMDNFGSFNTDEAPSRRSARPDSPGMNNSLSFTADEILLRRSASLDSPVLSPPVLSPDEVQNTVGTHFEVHENSSDGGEDSDAALN